MRHQNLSEKLSPRERTVLLALVAYTREHGYPPTRRELGDLAGLSSTSVVSYYLEKLEARGLIRWARGVARGISIVR